MNKNDKDWEKIIFILFLVMICINILILIWWCYLNLGWICY